MKFSQKIFIIAFMIIITSMYISGYLMIKSNYEKNIEKETQNAIYQVDSIISYMKVTVTDNTWDTDKLLIQLFSNVTSNKQIDMEVFRDNVLFYSNAMKEIEDIGKEDGKIVTSINTHKERTFLYTSTYLSIADRKYQIKTSRDITEIYKTREEQIDSFLRISLGLTFVAAFSLAISIFFATKRIRKLENKMIQVSKGNYIKKEKIKGRDEIADLDFYFEEMIEAIKKNVERLEEVSENRRIFIGDITHEIRSPLTAIIGYSDLLEHSKIKDETLIQRYAGKIHQEGEYIERLTEKLMPLVLLEKEQMKMEKKNLSEVIEKAVSMIQDILEIEIPMEVNIIENIYREVEPALIESLLLNLIKNSMKAVDSITGKIEVGLTENTMWVKDNGIGIPKEEIKKIVEPFYTMDKARNRKQGNMGLGLTLCKKIVEVHEAEMKIESQLGKGTVVSIVWDDEK